MLETENLQLPIYELDDAANLADGYNNAMEKLDAAYKTNEGRFPVNSANIEDGGVNTVDLANGAVTTNKLATAAVETDKIADGAVTADKLAEGAVEGSNIADAAIGTNQVADGAVTRPKIADSAFDDVPTENSANLIDSGAVWEALQRVNSGKPVIVCIGDSYGQGWTPDGTYKSWIQVLQEMNPQYEFVSQSLGGAGFTAGNNAFTTLLNNAINSMSQSQKNRTAIVLFGGGFNDRNYTQANIQAGMANCQTIVQQTFPKAVMMVSFFGCTVTGLASGGHEGATKVQCLTGMQYWYESAAKLGILATPDSVWWLYAQSLFSSDYVHPNTGGLHMIAEKLNCYINGSTPYSQFGEFSMSEAQTVAISTRGDKITLFVSMDANNKPYKLAGPTNFYNILSIVCNNTNTLSPSNQYHLADFTQPCLQGMRNIFHMVGQISYLEGNTKQYAPFTPVISLDQTGALDLKNCAVINKNRDNYVQNANVTEIDIYTFCEGCF